MKGAGGRLSREQDTRALPKWARPTAMAIYAITGVFFTVAAFIVGTLGLIEPALLVDLKDRRAASALSAEDSEENLTGDSSADALTGMFLKDATGGTTPSGHHRGEGSELSVIVFFSDAITTSFKELRNRALEIENGQVERFRRVYGRSDLWEIRLTPTSRHDPVRLRIPASGSCEQPHDICAKDKRPLTTAIETTIPAAP